MPQWQKPILKNALESLRVDFLGIIMHGCLALLVRHCPNRQD